MIEPIRGNIAVRQIEREEVSPGGIVIPGNATRPLMKGLVLAVGPGPLAADGSAVDMQCRVGDHILFPAGIQVQVRVENPDGDMETLLMMMEEKTFGIVARDQPLDAEAPTVRRVADDGGPRQVTLQ